MIQFATKGTEYQHHWQNNKQQKTMMNSIFNLFLIVTCASISVATALPPPPPPLSTILISSEYKTTTTTTATTCAAFLLPNHNNCKHINNSRNKSPFLQVIYIPTISSMSSNLLVSRQPQQLLLLLPWQSRQRTMKLSSSSSSPDSMEQEEFGRWLFDNYESDDDDDDDDFLSSLSSSSSKNKNVKNIDDNDTNEDGFDTLMDQIISGTADKDVNSHYDELLFGTPKENDAPSQLQQDMTSDDDNNNHNPTIRKSLSEILDSLEQQEDDDDDDDYNTIQNHNKNNQRQNYNNVYRHNYIRDPTDNNDDESQKPILDLHDINQLLSLRLRAKKRGDYELADELSDELLSKYNVHVWDKERMWTTNPNPPRKRGGNNKGSMMMSRFGPNGHDYVQIGGPVDTTKCSLSIKDIHALLAKRLECKLTGRYDEADELAMELFVNGVRVNDDSTEWRADGGTTFGTAEKGGEYPQKRQQQQQQQQQRKIKNTYRESKYSEPIPPHVRTNIINLLTERLNAKRSKDYDLADDIREELYELYNCAVDDRMKYWSVGGNFGPDSAFQWPNHIWEKIKTKNQMAGIAVVMEEEGGDEGRKSRRPWQNQQNLVKDYVMSSRSLPLLGSEEEEGGGGGNKHSSRDLEEVESLLRDRAKAKMEKDYKIADYIRDHLRDVYGIEIDDRLRQWSVGGRFDDGSGSSSSSSSSDVVSDDVDVNVGDSDSSEVAKQELWDTQRQDRGWYIRRGDISNLSSIDVRRIEGLIAERHDAMKRNNHEAANAALKQIEEVYGVVLDDSSYEWYLRDVSDENGVNRYVLSTVLQKGRALPGFVEENRDEVERLVEERAIAFSKENGNVVDSIELELLEKYGVCFEDRVKEWYVADDPEEIEKRIALKVDTARSKVVNSKDDAPIVDPTQMTAVLSSLTVPQLKSKLKEIGLRVGGRKNDLIDRLVEAQMMQATPWGDGMSSIASEEENAIASELSTEIQIPGTISVEESLSSMTVPQLKDKLRENGLPVGGRKADLIKRLSDLLAPTEEWVEENVSKKEKPIIEEAVSKETMIESDLTEEYLDNLSVIQLKDELRAANLPLSGRKADMIERLMMSKTSPGDLESFSQEVLLEDEDELLTEHGFFFADNTPTPFFAQETSEPVNASDSITSLSVSELKGKLRESGLPVSGRKSELIDRLASHMGNL